MSIRQEQKQHSRQALLDAALHLSTSGPSFAGISLREVTRTAGLVPAAFYRHFQNMDALGQELVDQVALHLKTILHQLEQAWLQHPETTTELGLELFFTAVDQHPRPWIFIIAERWGGTASVSVAIAREIDFLNQELANDLIRLTNVQQFHNADDLKALSSLLINQAFSWAMSWINLLQKTTATEMESEPELEKMLLKQQATAQLQLILRGMINQGKPDT
ncbi:TetR family transcriptional regulator [Acinetobacter sp. WZC-1]|uniref:TetR family transcriptional regulator n=1 Tax=Acinetobacter sp. WZC-1 TaxID=3459034 RepID=UPI00403D84C1